MEPPAFEAAAGEMFSGAGSQAPATGEVYDAGTGQSVVVLCGGTVPVRAVGYRAPADFEGEVSMVFYGTDQAMVTVARPAEPAEEAVPAAEPDTATEPAPLPDYRSEEHTSELQSLMRNSYAVFCLKKKQMYTTPKLKTVPTS